MQTVEERLWAKVDRRGPDECWEWTASTNGRYGMLSVKGHNVKAHRLSWEFANGRPVPDGMFVCHTCDNPPCVNPAHLFLGTNVDNMQDRFRKGRNGSVGWGPDAIYCKRGHAFHEWNIYRNRHGDRQCRRCRTLHDAARLKGIRGHLARLLLIEATTEDREG